MCVRACIHSNQGHISDGCSWSEYKTTHYDFIASNVHIAGSPIDSLLLKINKERIIQGKDVREKRILSNIESLLYPECVEKA
jgi:hypothetical protein